MKQLKHKQYYLLGAITLIAGIIILVVFLTLPLMNKEITYLGWISFAGVIIDSPLLFYSFYLLKKANFIKLQNTRKEVIDKQDNIENKENKEN